MRFRYAWGCAAFAGLFLSVTGMCQSTWNLVGNASPDVANCFRLTQNANHKTGAAWSSQMVNLNKPFDLYFRFNFGNSDNGADGLTVVLQKSPDGVNALGDDGANIGYGSLSDPITPSLDIEFDTHNNGSWMFNDIAEDHCAINGNGITSWTLAWPVSILPGGANVEDNLYHLIRISWQPSTNTINAYFDCSLLQSLTYDIRNNIFSGDSMVYYGITSATGDNDNAHYFCELYHEGGGDTTFCPGSPVTLGAATNFDSYSWSPATGLSCTNCLNPTADPPGSMTYVFTGTKDCLTVTDTVELSVDCILLPVELTSFDVVCPEAGAVLEWSTAGEVNNDYFIVEHSGDGRYFAEAGRVNGSGNTQEQHEYRFEHPSPFPGINYYRLKQVDYDGTFTYSPVRSATCASALGIMVYPNPFSGRATAELHTSGKEEVVLEVYSTSGHVMMAEKIEPGNEVMNITLIADEWPAGLYLIVAKNRDRVTHIPVVLY